MERDDTQHPDNEGEVNDDGVDVTLIRWMLSLTPEERLEVLENQVRALQELRDAIGDQL